MAYTTVNKSTTHHNNLLYTGNGSARTVTGVGFQPDFFWIKQRSGTQGHLLWDVARGGNYYLPSSATSTNAADIGTFTAASDGYSLATDGAYNGNTETYAAWNWLAGGSAGSSNTDGDINTISTSVNTTAKFSVSKYTGTGSNATIGHGLGVVPKCLIFKRLDSADDWTIYHASKGATYKVDLNNTNAATQVASVFNNTAPTSSLMTVGTNGRTNASGGSYLVYAFADVPGYSRFGLYKGNSSSMADSFDAPFIYTGFKPSTVIIKGVGANSRDWYMWNNKNLGYNPDNNELYPSDNGAEGTADKIYFMSNGFKLNHSGTGVNSDGEEYIYMAWGQTMVGSNDVACTAR